MRKWFGVGALSVMLASAGGYWYFTTTTTVTVVSRAVENRLAVNLKGDGDAEASDEVEPLVVDGGLPFSVQSLEPPFDEGPMARVVLEAGMQQPPRPEANQGRAPRMPYADEEEILAPLNPLMQILESTLPRFKIFEEAEEANPAEESEPRVVEPRPAMDYHHQHCPHHGGCPAPYYYRPSPRQ